MTLRDEGYLQDVLDSARRAISYLEGISFEELAENIQLQDSVVRRLEIIGEAAKHIAEEGATELPDLPWRKMVNMRNFIIHDYRGVDVKVVWETVRQQLPIAVDAIERYLSS
ncbi:MAG: hypothetical protein QOK37_2492 [Thermoanaerobaculia bacterium]|nr:hypothetical protein [Thermoanaerobaculia bacterium]